MSYAELYQRNEGILSKEEQSRLRSSHVFIAGVGGVGGIQAVTLARMGVGEISIMDPGIYDAPDLNRQYGAKYSTLGQNKASVVGEILRDIAPYASINVFSEKLNADVLRQQIQKTTQVVVDAIDMEDFQYKSMLAEIAREEGKYNMTAPIPDLGTVLITFAPDGMSFSDFTHNTRYPAGIMAIAKNRITPRSVQNDASPFLSSMASNSGAAALSGAILATEAALLIAGRRKEKELVVVPRVTYIDLLDRFFEVFEVTPDHP